MELTNESVGIDIPVNVGFNLLDGNNYFSPKSDNKIENCFNSLVTKLDTQNFRVILLGDFNVPGYDWLSPSQLPLLHQNQRRYSKRLVLSWTSAVNFHC
jgi:hypothetical protein